MKFELNLKQGVNYFNFVNSMKFKFLNNQLRNKRFSYSPRYYDERKEKLDAKKAHYQRVEDGSYSDEEFKGYLRQNLREEWSRSQHRNKQNRSANIRVLLLIFLILALGYFIFFGLDHVDNIVKKLW